MYDLNLGVKGFKTILSFVCVFVYRMIERDRDQNADTRQVHMDNLYRVVQYCENHTECRRVQVLHYFGESDFDPAECRRASATTCDNCQVSVPRISLDAGSDAKALVETVDSIVHKGNRNWRRPACKFTLNHVVDIFKVAYAVHPAHSGCNAVFRHWVPKI